MPAFTPNLNLYLPGGGSTGLVVPDETVDIDRLNENFRQIDDAVQDLRDVDRKVSVTVADSAERDALFPVPVAGDRVFRLDTMREELYLPARAQAAGVVPREAYWYPISGNMPHRVVLGGGSTALPSSAWTYVVMGAVSDYARSSPTEFNVVGGNGFECPYDGWYDVTLQMDLAGAAANGKGVRVYSSALNGSAAENVLRLGAAADWGTPQSIVVSEQVMGRRGAYLTPQAWASGTGVTATFSLYSARYKGPY